MMKNLTSGEYNEDFIEDMKRIFISWLSNEVKTDKDLLDLSDYIYDNYSVEGVIEIFFLFLKDWFLLRSSHTSEAKILDKDINTDIDSGFILHLLRNIDKCYKVILKSKEGYVDKKNVLNIALLSKNWDYCI